MQSYRPPAFYKQGRYRPLSVLGTGTYGQVIRCRDEQSGEDVAIKVAQQNAAYRLSALNEIRALQALHSCPDVVKMLDCFEDDGHVCIVTELLDKNLYDVLRGSDFAPLRIADIRSVATHLLCALAALHQVGYMHCDVKPENIMLRRGTAPVDCAPGPHHDAGALAKQKSLHPALQELVANRPCAARHGQLNQFLPRGSTSWYALASGAIESPSDDAHAASDSSSSSNSNLTCDESRALVNMYAQPSTSAAQIGCGPAAPPHRPGGAANGIFAMPCVAPVPRALTSPHTATAAGLDFASTCLIDFGAVRGFGENNYFDVQSLWYRAPEVLCELPYTVSIDAWSVGCVLFELYTGKPLFPGKNTRDQLSRIVQLLGYPSQAAQAACQSSAAHAALAPRTRATMTTTTACLRRGMRRCRRLNARAARAKAAQGGEQAYVTLDEVLSAGVGRGTRASHNSVVDDEGENDDDDAESELLNLILALLNPNEEVRLGCRAALSHPFLARPHGGTSVHRTTTPPQVYVDGGEFNLSRSWADGSGTTRVHRGPSAAVHGRHANNPHLDNSPNTTLPLSLLAPTLLNSPPQTRTSAGPPYAHAPIASHVVNASAWTNGAEPQGAATVSRYASVAAMASRVSTQPLAGGSAATGVVGPTPHSHPGRAPGPALMVQPTGSGVTTVPLMAPSMLQLPAATSTGGMEVKVPLYGVPAAPFAANADPTWQHVTRSASSGEFYAGADTRPTVHGESLMNGGTVLMPMGVSPVMYYQPLPMTLQPVQPRLDLHPTTRMPGAAASGNRAATPPSQGVFSCYLGAPQTQSFTARDLAFPVKGATRRDLEEGLMQGGLVFQMAHTPSVTATDLYATASCYPRTADCSCLARETYCGGMDGMYYFNVSLPLV